MNRKKNRQGITQIPARFFKKKKKEKISKRVHKLSSEKHQHLRQDYEEIKTKRNHTGRKGGERKKAQENQTPIEHMYCRAPLNCLEVQVRTN